MPLTNTSPYFIPTPIWEQGTTLNPSDLNGPVVLSNGDLTASRTVDNTVTGSVRSIAGFTSGKWYVEMTVDNISTPNEHLYVGFVEASESLADNPHTMNGLVVQNVNPWSNGVAQTTTGLPVWGNGSIMQYAVDFDIDRIWIGIDGTFSGINYSGFLGATGSSWKFIVGTRKNPLAVPITVTTKFTGPFAYAPPVGF